MTRDRPAPKRDKLQYPLDDIQYEDERGIYYDRVRDARGADFFWTLFCGADGEEIDVAAWSEEGARAIGEVAIAKDYEPITIDRVERRYRGLTYF